MTELVEKVNTFFKDYKRKGNPYAHKDSSSGKDEPVHPHQLNIINNNNIIFRRAPQQVITYFDQWLMMSELGQLFRNKPYFLRVMDYLKYRSTAYSREGFILRNKHVVDGSDYTLAFAGDRATFYKYLYALEQLGVVIIDKRMYANYIWFNYDVVGKYAIHSTHSEQSKFSDKNINEWKIRNRIYNVEMLDDKAKLEMLWSYQLGFRAHYDMFDNEGFSKYSKGISEKQQFDVGDSDTNKYDMSLRNSAFDSRRVRNMTGIESRPLTDNRLPTETFKYGGKMKIGKNHKQPSFDFDNVRTLNDTIDSTSITKKEASSDEIIFKNEIVNDWKTMTAKQLDWDNFDFTTIDFKQVDKRYLNSFKRAIVSKLDDWFVEGFNSSNRSKIDSIAVTKFVNPFPPQRTDERVKYYATVSSIFANIFMQYKDSGIETLKGFCHWIGKNYYYVFNDLSWFSVVNSELATSNLNRKGVVPGWHYFIFKNEKGENGILKEFKNRFEKAWRMHKEKQMQPITRPVNSVNQNVDIGKLKESLEQEYTEKVAMIEQEYKSRDNVADMKYKNLFKALVNQGYDPLALAINKLEKVDADIDDTPIKVEKKVNSIVQKSMVKQEAEMIIEKSIVKRQSTDEIWAEFDKNAKLLEEALEKNKKPATIVPERFDFDFSF